MDAFDTPKDKRKCSTCWHWLEVGGPALLGVCRRTNPDAVMVGLQPSQITDPSGVQMPPQPIVRGFFPITGRLDVCSQWWPNDVAYVPLEALYAGLANVKTSH
jgi:hypothetical protein